MPFYTCASVCKPSTTNLRRDEDKGYEKESGCESSQVCAVCRTVHCGGWLCGDAALELADTDCIWLACYRLLAGDRHFGAEQNFVRRVPGTARPPHALAWPHDGALGTDDSRGTREVSRIHARAMRVVRAARCGTEGMRGWTLTLLGLPLVVVHVVAVLKGHGFSRVVSADFRCGF